MLQVNLHEEGGTAEAAAGEEAVAAGAPNPRLLFWGFPADVAAAALNPGLRDPFHPDADVTLNNAAYSAPPLWPRWGLMQGKLDWVLLRGLPLRPGPGAARMGNHDYALSDHKWLAVSVDA